jgi:hypothetical protein
MLQAIEFLTAKISSNHHFLRQTASELTRVFSLFMCDTFYSYDEETR